MSAERVPPAIAVVLDTNVLISLYVFADSRYAQLRTRIESGVWQAVTNAACLDELSRVLTYPMFKLTTIAQESALIDYLRYARRMDLPARSDLVVSLPRCTDADDQKFLELARDSHARWLITSDRALLKLSRRLKQAGMFSVITPDTALAET